MTNLKQPAMTAEELVLEAVEHLTNELKSAPDSGFGIDMEHFIDQAGAYLRESIKRVPTGINMSVETASRILAKTSAELHQVHLSKGKLKFSPPLFDKLVGDVTGAAPTEGVVQRVNIMLAQNKIGAIIVDHSGKAAGIAGLATLMAAWLMPSKQQEKTLPDGTKEASAKWTFAKKATVTVGAVVSAGLLAHYAHGKWAGKIFGEAAKDLGRGA